MISVGIDIGMQGAIAAVDGTNLVYLEDMPTTTRSVGRRQRGVIDTGHIAADLEYLCNQYAAADLVVAIEEAQLMSKGMWAIASLHLQQGVLEGVCATLGLRHELVAPRTWQSYFRGSRQWGKQRSMQFAKQLYPLSTLTTKRGRQLDGRADAILIAEWLQRKRHLGLEVAS